MRKPIMAPINRAGGRATARVKPITNPEGVFETVSGEVKGSPWILGIPIGPWLASVSC